MSLSQQPLAYGRSAMNAPVSEERRVLRRAASAAFMGNFVEWFDYAAYGYLAAVIAVVFFPQTDKVSGLLATFAVFALSFIVRPIGGIVWGHIGDRFGRRNALSLSILIMSGSTFCIALLPGYAQAGLAAPGLLLAIRLVQGFSASGEYAGASAFLTEYAPEGKRGFYTCLVPASTAAGLLVGSLFAAQLYAHLDSAQLHEWGWRLPFLLAAPLGLIGRYIRLHLADTPKFREMEAAMEQKQGQHRAPIRELFGTHRKHLLVAVGATCLNAVAFYLILSYMPTYLSAEMGMSESDSFLASTVSLATYIGFIFLMGKLSDRFGRKTMLVAASLLFLALTVPLFRLLGDQSFAFILLIQIGFGLMLAMNDGTLPCFLAEIFPTRVRYTGFAFSFNTANALFGGTAPFIATWLISLTGNKLAPAWMLVAAAAVALLAMLCVRETAHRPMED
ncbi:MHS family proline/betaine transporter-like MFS transporter [Pseudomonas citronellolis]|nr:MHS family proline/betaine transporter-like MFS transporter [Pseudomonas citronellolis]MCP1664235.1 MHS family proline/betaine transporter-like MFS transporter [Pseudomonas citronellolis]MCP1695209.1 MHS family proline/betaine transporter-like MFS transporter [Pseudomonas citronellolis]MCP1702070.1 MHS family proline/betaine transporter-like MFS transporter [Pseudomonas citronellolis]MCP1795956.1 MHS family proline/betaine transporter-like MFS transporter [Pseudomonas citronellolis]